MLILTRRVGETIMICDDISVTVLGIKGNQARIGIEAPKDLPVHRLEVFEKIREQEAANGGNEVSDSDNKTQDDKTGE